MGADQPTPKRAERKRVTREEVDSIEPLYERGLCSQLYERARLIAPLEAWSGPEACAFAGWLATHLGAPKLGRRLHFRAWREDNKVAISWFGYAYAVFELRGPLAAWNFLKRRPAFEAAPARDRSDLLTLQARCASMLHDFQRAEALLHEAEEIDPTRPWVQIERAASLEQQDRYDEALEAAHRAQAMHKSKCYRPAVQFIAHLLQLLDRDDEAIATLEEGSRHLESGAVAAQLGVLLTELGEYDRAERALDLYETLSPLREKETSEWLAGQRSRVAYLSGDVQRALNLATQADDRFHKYIAEQMQKNAGARARVRLPVTFVRQHFRTCAPATMAALARFWKKSADHLSIAEAICYDGTPSHLQRDWAERNGWTVREFRLTWDSAVALLDRGLPFTVSTVEPANAHLQAVIGYDSLRRTFLVRDPYNPYVAEALADPFLDRYKANGPQCMLLVPADRSDVLDGIELPDAPMYDASYRIEMALAGHDRTTAARILAQIEAESPSEPLTWRMRWTLGSYDGNAARVHECVDALLARFPEDANLEIAKLQCLRARSREERCAYLEEVCNRTNPNPLMWAQYAQELRGDARQHLTAERYLQRSMRFRPLDAVTFAVLGDIRWEQRRFVDATELYRFAASFDDKRESLARAWFSASRQLKQASEVLEWLQDRLRRFGHKSAMPAITLFGALEQIDRVGEGFDVLADALKLKPGDEELLRFAAETHARFGKRADAERLLDAAKGKSHRTAWLRTAATIAGFAGDLRHASSLWGEVVDAEPLAIDAHRALAHAIASIDGRAAALNHLQNACERFPHHHELHQLWIEWLRNEDPQKREQVTRHLVAMHPADANAQRELAHLLIDTGRFEEAREVTNLALSLEPNAAASYSALGRLEAELGNALAAKTAFRRAIELSVDTAYAIEHLLAICASQEERKEELRFVEDELIKQVVYGDGLLAFRDAAQPILDPDELLKSLRFALKERPDLWHAWSAMTVQLTSMQQLDEALETATEAARRFPLLPRLWMDLSLVHEARLDRGAQIDALRRAVEINPTYHSAATRLCEALERNDQLADASSLMERTVMHDPLLGWAHGCLANVLWKCGKRTEALERLQEALERDPGYEWAWETLARWSAEMGKPELAHQLARTLTETRPGEPRSWFMLAVTLPDDQYEQRIAALNEAIARSPRFMDALDLKAFLLVRAGRCEEALEVCRHTAWNDKPPVPLRGRAAWIEAERGDCAAAVRLMRQVLADDPTYCWGWQQLVDWLLESGDLPEAKLAAERVVRIIPLDAQSVACLAGVKRKMGERDGAKSDFARAVKLRPDYAFAGLNLIDLQLEDGELAAAEQTIASLRRHNDSGWVAAREVMLRARQRNRRDAFALFEQLCRSSADEDWPVRAAAEALIAAGWRWRVRRVLARSMRCSDGNPNVGVVWTQQFGGRRWRAMIRLSWLANRSEAARRGLMMWVGQFIAPLATQTNVHLGVPVYLRWLIFRHGHWISRDDPAWAQIGYALITHSCYKRAAAWMSDWKTRPRVPPWALNNLVVALYATGRDDEANEVIRHALERGGEASTNRRLRVWLAFDAILAADLEVASGVAERIDEPGLDGYEKPIFKLTSSLIDLARLEASQRHFSPETRQSLKQFWQALYRDKPMRRRFHRAIQRVCLLTGSRKPWWWALSTRWTPMAIGCGLTALIIYIILRSV